MSKRSSTQTLSIVWNRKSKARTSRTWVHPKIIKSKGIPGVWGCKITKKRVTRNSCVIPSKKSGRKRLQIWRTEIPPKIPPKMRKRKTHGIKGFGTRLRWRCRMNYLAISGYKPYTRITNLGRQKAQTKSQITPLSPSLPKALQNERVHTLQP